MKEISDTEIPPNSGDTQKIESNRPMSDILIFLGVIFTWFALQKWILPKFGIPT